ncbi:MAG: TIGR03619 family F420-dependent LLM class oxidoreductase [Alphaproteobacteria bacterium]|jgi:probable F420-dependent oxidoreductase|nr:TIGR03619 family F420-dependent LLM class oxidoreductase [Alphaproteobacteria bacterium]MDP6812855.1 TIGR03619 family F420-dependent LLM class oxidoreductase [Alphaproteobacteria bacterium]
MRFGFYLPTRGPLGNPDDIAEIARAGEGLGYGTIVIGDHIVFPIKVASPYPYTVDGGFPGVGDAMEQLTLMSYVAGITTTPRLVTSVMILPHRNPLVTAKILATIDVLSKGRVTVGVGVGWMREEFEALGAPDFDKRGAASNEYLEIFKKCWTRDPVSHDGEFYAFKDLHCQPQPVQKPHPPIWIGGHSRAALRRVAKYGDGWHPVGATSASPLAPGEFQGLLDELKRLVEAEGRDFAALTISFKAPSYDPGLIPEGHDRLLFTGEPERIAEDLRAYQAMGVHEVVFDFRSPPAAKTIENMDHFMREVAPLVT